MKSALVILILGTVVSGLAGAYASTVTQRIRSSAQLRAEERDSTPISPILADGASQRIAAAN